MADELVQFGHLIPLLNSSNNLERKNAEEIFNKIDNEKKIILMLQLISSDINIDIKRSCAVLTRNVLSKIKDFPNVISGECQNFCKNNVIQLTLKFISEKKMFESMCELSAELIECYLDKKGQVLWPEINETIISAMVSNDAIHKELAYNIIYRCPKMFGKSLFSKSPIILKCLNESLLNPAECFLALITALNIIYMVTNNKVLKAFKQIVPNILQSITLINDNEKLDKILEIICCVVEESPTFFNLYLSDFIKLMLHIIETTNKTIAVEIVVLICELAPNTIKKRVPELVPNLINVILKMMVSVDMNPDFELDENEPATYEESDDESDDGFDVVGATSFDRIAVALKGKFILDNILSIILPMLTHYEWKYRNAALLVLSSIAEGTMSKMKPLLGQIVAAVSPLLLDQSQRVRFAAVNAIGQFATDFPYIFHKNCHQQCFPYILKLIAEDQNSPKVHCQAVMSINNLCDGCPDEVFTIYYSAFVTCLHNLFHQKIQNINLNVHYKVFESVISSISKVAETAGSKFIDSYDKFMPSLKLLLSQLVDPKYYILFGRVIDCVASIAIAVGKEKFSADASDFMSSTLAIIKPNNSVTINVDDCRLNDIITAWGQFCSIMGCDFMQFIPHILQPLIQLAGLKGRYYYAEKDIIIRKDPDFIKSICFPSKYANCLNFVSEQFNSLEKIDYTDFDVVKIDLGNENKFGIDTKGFAEKILACQLISDLSENVGHYFAEFVDQVFMVMACNLTCCLDDDVVTAAAKCIPSLLKCLYNKENNTGNSSVMMSYWKIVSPSFELIFTNKYDDYITSDLIDCYTTCLEIILENSIEPSSLQNIYNFLSSFIDERLQSLENNSDEEDDDDDCEEATDNEEEDFNDDFDDEDDDESLLNSNVRDLIHVLLKTNPQNFCQCYEHLLPKLFTVYEHKSSTAEDHSFFVCTLDSFIEFCGKESFKYHQKVLPVLFKGIKSTDADMAQACAYGMGMLAKCSDVNYHPYMNDVIKVLFECINQPDEDGYMASVKDNCLSSICRICKHAEVAVSNIGTVIMNALQLFPIKEDYVEIYETTEFVYDLIMNNKFNIKTSKEALFMVLKCFAYAIFHACEYEEHVKLLPKIVQIIQTPEFLELWPLVMNLFNEQEKLVISQNVQNINSGIKIK